MAAPFYTPSGAPVQGSAGVSKTLRDEFGLVETGLDVLNLYGLTVQFEDLNTPASRYVVVPWSCKLITANAVIDANNASGSTTITFEIGGVAVTMDGTGNIIFLAAALASNIKTATAVSGNSVTAVQAIEVVTDGGGSGVMPGRITLNLKRV